MAASMPCTTWWYRGMGDERSRLIPIPLATFHSCSQCGGENRPPDRARSYVHSTRQSFHSVWHVLVARASIGKDSLGPVLARASSHMLACEVTHIVRTKESKMSTLDQLRPQGVALPPLTPGPYRKR